MNVTLNPELQRFVEEKIRTGQFANADDAINSALAALRAQETLKPDDIAALRREIAIGIEQLDGGLGEPWDAAALKEEIRQRVRPK
jgi:antitoxin ParD1/3/4